MCYRSFLGEVDQADGLRLHAIRELERLNAAQQFGFFRMTLQVFCIQSSQQIELATLIGASHILRAIEVEDRVALRAKESALITRRQKARMPVERAAFDSLV